MKKVALTVLALCCAVSLSFTRGFGEGGEGRFRGGGFNRHSEPMSNFHPSHEPAPNPEQIHPGPHPYPPEPEPRPYPPHPGPHPYPPGPGPHPYPPHPGPYPYPPGPHPYPPHPPYPYPPGPHPYPYPWWDNPGFYYPYPIFTVGFVYNLTPSDSKYDSKKAQEYDDLNSLEAKKYYAQKDKEQLSSISFAKIKYTAKPSPSVTFKVANNSDYTFVNMNLSFALNDGKTTVMLNDIFYNLESTLKKGAQKTCTVPLKDIKTKLPDSAAATVTIEKITTDKGMPVPSAVFTEDDQKQLDKLKKKLDIKSDEK